MSGARVTISPATPHDFLELAGTLPPYRCIAWAARHEGKVIGIGGVQLMPNGARYAFVDMKDEARKFRKTLHKTGLQFLASLPPGSPIVATTRTNVPRADEWLLRLGFEKHGEGDEKVFIWRSAEST